MVKLPGRELCSRCKGSGQVRYLFVLKRMCGTCRGWGWVRPKEGE